MNEKFFDLKKEKQDRMLNAALQVFAENGFRRASTDEMVKKAGISKGLLFHYFTSKAGLYEFLYNYSVKYLTMELSSSVSAGETDYFALCAQVEKAKTDTMKNFPYMILFLQQAAREDDQEARELMRESAEALLAAYDTIFERVDLSGLNGISAKRLVKIVDYTLSGLLQEMIFGSGFKPEHYYKEAIAYLTEIKGLVK